MPETANEPHERDEGPPVEPDRARYLLRLFVTGMTPRSTDAIARIKAICEEHLNGHYDLEVIDIYQQPDAARVEQIIATPTLIKKAAAAAPPARGGPL